MLKRQLTVFVGKLVEGIKLQRITYLELLNKELGERVRFLEESLRYEREINRALLAKLGINERIQSDFKKGEYRPIGRPYIPIRDKVAEAERKSREELKKLEESNAKS